jgi:FAD synthase
MITEQTKISAFNVRPDGQIEVRKTTEIIKDDAVIASTHWRTVLQPNDPSANEVLDEPYYLDLATLAWESLPEQPIAPLAEAEAEADEEEEAETEAEEPTETQEIDE